MNIFELDDMIDFLLDQADYLENIEEIERLKMESNTIKAGLGLIDLNVEKIFSKDIIWDNINNYNFKAWKSIFWLIFFNNICSRVIFIF